MAEVTNRDILDAVREVRERVGDLERKIEALALGVNDIRYRLGLVEQRLEV